MTFSQLQILQHSLGVDEFGQGKRYRNHFVAGDQDARTCRELVELGFMSEHPGSQLSDGLPIFAATASGIDAMYEASPKPKKKTASQKRFQEFLSFSDCYDCTFRQWLDIRKTDWYRAMKEGREVLP